MRPDTKCPRCSALAKWTKEESDSSVSFFYLCENGHKFHETKFF